MVDDTSITSTAVWAAFIRHMAIMCRNGQRSVDCILPALLWDTRLCEHVMTGVLIQFKRRKRSGTVAEYSVDQAEFDFFPKTLEKCTHGSIPTFHRPYISLIMELGVQLKTPKKAKTATIYKPASSSKKKSDGCPQTPPPIEGGPDRATPSKIHIPQYGQHHPQKGHAIYNAFAYGCSPTVYRGIDVAHKASNGCANTQSGAANETIWNGGDDCYHWVQHDDILQFSKCLQQSCSFFRTGGIMV